MAEDPYKNMPSREELEAAGATDWLSETLAEQQKRDASLKAALGGETKSLKAKKKDLRGVLELPPDTDPEEEVPDLLAQERAEVAGKASELSGLMGDLSEKRAAEKDLLKNLFGK